METGGVAKTAALDAALSAWLEVAGAGGAGAETAALDDAPGQTPRAAMNTSALSRDGFVERMLGTSSTSTTATTTPAPVAGAHIEHGPETANMQTFARPQVAVAEPLRSADTALPSATHAASEFAVPAAQLVPTTLTGLQVQPAWGWPLPYRSEPQAPKEVPAPAFESAAAPIDGEAGGDEDAHDEADEADEKPHDHADNSGVVFEDAGGDDWREVLTGALRSALAARIAPQALLAAAEQWRRGRCVVLACPQGADAAGPAWAFVLWPRPRSRRAAHDPAQPLALYGLRVEARLQWCSPPRPAQWCHVRVVKEHHPRRGRQLLVMDDAATAAGSAPRKPVPCEVQLGPVLARSLRWCEVCVRINAVRRFWAALGTQWSVHVVVCAQPLAGSRVLPIEEPSC